MILFRGNVAFHYKAQGSRYKAKDPKLVNFFLVPCALYLEPCTTYLQQKLMFRLDGKKAAVTGGGSGIGKAVAHLFAKQGAAVYVIDLNEESANATVKEIQKDGGKAITQACDVTSQLQVQE